MRAIAPGRAEQQIVGEIQLGERRRGPFLLLLLLSLRILLVPTELIGKKINNKRKQRKH